MKVLFIGGTGVISSSCSQLCLKKGYDLFLLNRGKSIRTAPEGAKIISGDINDVEAIKKLIEKPCQELAITQEMRQVGYDNYQTTDDHGMLIYGMAKDQTGKKFYMVKNSWGTDNKFKGTWYASEAFVAYKTMNIIVHKDALPKAIAKKLGIK